MRKLLSTTVLCGGVFLLTAGFDALAATGSVLTPNSNWAISKIAADEAGGDAYCALARRFTGDLILTMARNSRDESSFAIDFQAETLNKAQNYYVVLRSGAGLERTFEVRPVSGRAMVIRLGKDYAFYDALNRSSRLEVDIAGKPYSFEISGFDDGQDRLNGCLATLAEPAAGEEAVPVQAAASPPAPRPQPEPVTQELLPAAAPTTPAMAATSGREIQALREENTRLRNALERERRTFENKFMQEAGDSSQTAELSEKIRLLEDENRTLQRQISAMPPQTGAGAIAGEIDSLRNENATLRKQVERLAADSRPDNSIATITRLQGRIDELGAENEGLKQAGAAGGDMAVKVRVLESENASLRSSLQSVSDASGTEAETLRAENARLRADLDNRMRQQDDFAAGLNGKVAELEAENRSLQQRVASLSVPAAPDKSALDSLNREVETLRGENASLRKKIVASTEGTDLKAEIGRLQDRIASLETENAGLRMASGENTADDGRLQARVDLLESENTRLRQSLETARSSAGTSDITLARLQEVEAALRDAEAQRDSFARQIDDMTSGKESNLLNISSSNWNLEQATRRFNEAEREIRRLGTQLEQERTQCGVEKKDIESLLFDPEIASREQISKLRTLEQKLAEKDAKIAALETRSTISPVQQASVMPDRSYETAYRAPLVESEPLAQPEGIGERLAAIQPAAGPGNEEVLLPPFSDSRSSPSAAPAPATYTAYNDRTAVTDIPSQRPAGNAGAIQTLLEHSRVALSSGIQPVSGASTQGFSAYTWETGGVFGSAEQHTQAGDADFERLATQYLEKTKNRCTGEFAAVPGLGDRNGSLRVSAYEIACLGAEGDASAAVLFFSRDGVFTIVAHEAGVDNMDVAMDIRDKLVSTLLETQIAAR